MKHKISDLVIKKTGGNKMTISSYDSINRIYTCYWFIDSVLKTKDFYEDEIINYNDFKLFLIKEERDDKINNILK